MQRRGASRRGRDAGGQAGDARRRCGRTRAAPTPDVLALGALTLQIIDRGGRLGVRLKDMKSPARAAFKGLHYFPIDPRYRVVATFVPQTKPVTLNVPTVLGTVERMPSPGYASFAIAGAPAARSRCGSTPCWSRARRSCSSSSVTRRRARRPTAADGSSTRIRPSTARSSWTSTAPTRRPARSRRTRPARCRPPNNRLPVAIEAGEMFAGHH